jgi:hypothetical protein
MGVIGTVCNDRIRLGIGNIGERPVDLGLRRWQGRSLYGPSAEPVAELFQTMAEPHNIANNSQHR